MFFTDMNRLSLNDGRYPSISNVFGGSSNMAAWAPEANKSAAAAAAAQFSQRMMDGGAKLRKRSGSANYNTPAPLPAGAQPPVSAPLQQPQKYMPMPRPPLSAIAAAGKIPILGPKLSSAAGKFVQDRKLKTTVLPRETLPRFLAIAKLNTSLNRETCGLLLGKELKPGEGSPSRERHRSSNKSEFVVTTLLIPKQHGTSDMCTMDGEELVLNFTEERSLITLGWVSFVRFSYQLPYVLLTFPCVDSHPPITVVFYVFCGSTHPFWFPEDVA
jgi:STAM-binding protein